jgi:hypothetical protein
LKNIETSTEVLKSLRHDVQSGKGIAGTMIQNEQLSTNVQTLANNLAAASSHLNRPGLWHQEPVRPPPGGTPAANNPAKP